VKCWASSRSTSTCDPYQTFFLPTPSFLGCLEASAETSLASTTFTTTVEDSTRAVKRGAIGSMTFLLKAQILSHSIITIDLDEPCETIKSFKPWTVIPRRRTPRTVGIRGSSQPLTILFSTNHVNFRLLKTVFCKLSRLYSQM